MFAMARREPVVASVRAGRVSRDSIPDAPNDRCINDGNVETLQWYAAWPARQSRPADSHTPLRRWTSGPRAVAVRPGRQARLIRVIRGEEPCVWCSIIRTFHCARGDRSSQVHGLGFGTHVVRSSAGVWYAGPRQEYRLMPSRLRGQSCHLVRLRLHPEEAGGTGLPPSASYICHYGGVKLFQMRLYRFPGIWQFAMLPIHRCRTWSDFLLKSSMSVPPSFEQTMAAQTVICHATWVDAQNGPKLRPSGWSVLHCIRPPTSSSGLSLALSGGDLSQVWMGRLHQELVHRCHGCLPVSCILCLACRRDGVLQPLYTGAAVWSWNTIMHQGGRFRNRRSTAQLM